MHEPLVRCRGLTRTYGSGDAAIARALVHRHELLVCDEPTSNLDHQTGHDIMQVLRDMADTEGFVPVRRPMRNS